MAPWVELSKTVEIGIHPGLLLPGFASLGEEKRRHGHLF